MNTKYSDRTVDLWIGGEYSFQFGKREQLSQTLSLESGGKICTGIAKLTQKVLICLLTYSHYYDPFWGTDLPMMLAVKQYQKAVSKFQELFPLAAATTVTLLRSQETLNDPLDERVAEITLESMTSDRNTGNISARIRIDSVAGDNTELVLPINKLIGSGS